MRNTPLRAFAKDSPMKKKYPTRDFSKKADYKGGKGTLGHKVAKAFIPDLSSPKSIAMEVLPVGKAKKLYKVAKAAWKGVKS